MQINEALKELKKNTKDLENVGDVTQFIKNNKEEFIIRWARVNKYYCYIINNTEEMSDEWFEAVGIISDAALNNPDLDLWLEMIIDPKNEKPRTNIQSNEYIDTTSLSNHIDAIVNEIERIHHWDPEYVDYLANILQDDQIKLIQYRGAFEPDKYDNLMNDINASLEKIGRFNNLVRVRILTEMDNK